MVSSVIGSAAGTSARFPIAFSIERAIAAADQHHRARQLLFADRLREPAARCRRASSTEAMDPRIADQPAAPQREQSTTRPGSRRRTVSWCDYVKGKAIGPGRGSAQRRDRLHAAVGGLKEEPFPCSSNSVDFRHLAGIGGLAGGRRGRRRPDDGRAANRLPRGNERQQSPGRPG